MKRKKTREVKIGSVTIGGDSPVAVQSMTKTDTRDTTATLSQILRLEEEGCRIVRVAIPDMQAAEAVAVLKKSIGIPIVADIHFDHRLALEAMRNGADKIRINPGNLGGEANLRTVANEAKSRGISIRIGINSGSLEKHLLEKYGSAVPKALVESAMDGISRLEDIGFKDIVVSVKSSRVADMIEAYRLLSQKTDVPLHLGVTEAGTVFSGTVKSSVGIGVLLAEGIGDTIRVSLTGDPVKEVHTGFEILKALNMEGPPSGFELISCPGCGRCQIDIWGIAEEVEKRLTHLNIDSNMRIAVMGCAVNGPGEARDADIGIAGGDGCAVLFKKGKVIRRLEESDIIDELLAEVRSMLERT